MRRLGSSILCPVCVSWVVITFLSCWFFADFEDLSRCAFSLQGKKSLSFLTFSLSIFKSSFLI